jgi:hypothetical protein
MSDMIQRIRMAQVRAAEDLIVSDLQQKGLAASPSVPTPTPSSSAQADAVAVLRELVEANVPIPAAEHGEEAQRAWAIRLNRAWDRARSILSGEPKPALQEAEAFVSPEGRVLNVSLTRGYLGVNPTDAANGYRIAPCWLALSASPATAPGRVPPTDERILHLWDTHVAYETGASKKQPPLVDADKINFARAVLSAADGEVEGAKG